MQRRTKEPQRWYFREWGTTSTCREGTHIFGAAEHETPGVVLFARLTDVQGPVFFQAVTRKLVMEHRQQEEVEGQEIWPATPKDAVAEHNQVDVDFCDQLECATSNGLEW